MESLAFRWLEGNVLNCNRRNGNKIGADTIRVFFPSGSDDEESTCNAGDMGSIPGLGRTPGGGRGNHYSILAWRIPMDKRSLGRLHTVHGITKSWT